MTLLIMIYCTSIKMLLEEIANKSTLLNMCIAQVLRWKVPRDNQSTNFVDVVIGNIFIGPS